MVFQNGLQVQFNANCVRHARRAIRCMPFFLAVAGCATLPPDTQSRAREVIALRATPVAAGKSDGSASLETLTAELTRQPLSADSAVALAYLHSRTLRERFAGLDIAEADLAQAGLLSNPTLFTSLRFPNSSGLGNNLEFSLSAQVLDVLMQPARRRMARAEFERVQAGVTHDALGLLEDVRVAWVRAVASAQAAEHHGQIAEAAALAGELARRFRSAGNVSPAHVAQAEAEEAETHAQALRVRTAAAGDRAQLARLLMLPAPAEWTLPAELPALPPHDPALAQAADAARERRLDLAAARSNVEALRRALATAKAWGWTGGAVAVGVDTERDPSGLRVTGPTLSIGLPIFDHKQAATARLAAQLQQAEAGAEALDREIDSDVRGAHARLLAARELVELYAARVIPARAAELQELQLEQNYMLTSVFDLLSAKQRQLQAQASSTEARRDYWLAAADLDRSIGGATGTEEQHHE
jgi:cobalt-zinc-cadmium efflux system outer membrane protein